MSARRFVARGLIVIGALAGALVGLHATSRASLFGEENVTLGAILTEAIKSYSELRNITDAVGDGVEVAGDLLDAYHKVNAGIDELRGYSVDAFLHDFKGDMYRLYPGLAKIEYGSQLCFAKKRGRQGCGARVAGRGQAAIAAWP